MRRLRNWIQHLGNPVHVYCRLCDLGVSAHRATRWALWYEFWLYRRVFW